MKYFLSIILTTAGFLLFGQSSNFNSQRNWSLNKKELMFQIGATQFLGDLGGKDKIGKDYSLADIDFPSTGFNIGFGYRFRFKPHFATTSLLNVGLVRGDDALTKEMFRNARNLNFRSPVINFHQRLEYIFFANEKYGKRYSLSGIKGFKDHNEQIYVFSGVGIAYFNPQGQHGTGWTNLRPLKTEGQGLSGGPAVYNPYTITIPFGIGFRMGLSKMWRIGIEATYVKTFTDYIDDVSGIYYDPAALAAQVGQQSAQFSNPSANPDWFNAGSQRGDKQKDAYFYLNLTVSKNITYKNYAKRNRQIRYKGGRAKF